MKLTLVRRILAPGRVMPTNFDYQGYRIASSIAPSDLSLPQLSQFLLKTPPNGHRGAGRDPPWLPGARDESNYPLGSLPAYLTPKPHNDTKVDDSTNQTSPDTSICMYSDPNDGSFDCSAVSSRETGGLDRRNWLGAAQV